MSYLKTSLLNNLTVIVSSFLQRREKAEQAAYKLEQDIALCKVF